jgi:hypothetical protein
MRTSLELQRTNIQDDRFLRSFNKPRSRRSAIVYVSAPCSIRLQEKGLIFARKIGGMGRAAAAVENQFNNQMAQRQSRECVICGGGLSIH